MIIRIYDLSITNDKCLVSKKNALTFEYYISKKKIIIIVKSGSI